MINQGPGQYFFPEIAAGGYSALDGTIEFYSRVQTLLKPEMTVLDFGAGRAHWAYAPANRRQELRSLQGHCAKLIGCDVDPAVLSNPKLDQAFVCQPGDTLPLEDASVDLIVSDYVLEHIEDPEAIAREWQRILKPGGWICARTPHRFSYLGLATTLIANRWHQSWLRKIQPGRKAEDVFPTHYRLNSLRSLKRHFPSTQYHHASYLFVGEPAYHFNRRWVFAAFLLLHKWAPRAFCSNIFVFLQKREA